MGSATHPSCSCNLSVSAPTQHGKPVIAAVVAICAAALRLSSLVWSLYAATMLTAPAPCP